MRLAVMGSFSSTYVCPCCLSLSVFLLYFLGNFLSIYLYFYFLYIPTFLSSFFISIVKFLKNSLSVPLKNHPTLVLLIFLKDLIFKKILVIGYLKIFSVSCVIFCQISCFSTRFFSVLFALGSLFILGEECFEW